MLQDNVIVKQPKNESGSRLFNFFFCSQPAAPKLLILDRKAPLSILNSKYITPCSPPHWRPQSLIE